MTRRRHVKIYRARLKPLLWEIRWHYGGKVHRQKFTERALAETRANVLEVTIANGKGAGYRLVTTKTDPQLSRLEQAQEIAEQDGTDVLDEMLQARARRTSEKRRHAATALKVPQLVAKFLAAKQTEAIGKYHLRDLNIRLPRFAAAFQEPITLITTDHVRAWLDALTWIRHRHAKHKKTEPIGPKTWNNYRDAITSLAKWATAKKYCDWSDLAALPKRAIPHKDPEIFTPKKLQQLLAATADNVSLRLVILLGAFAGLRTEEIWNLRWDDIKWDDNQIFVRHCNKTGQRDVPLEPNLRLWLQAAGPQTTGKLCDYKDAKSLAGMKTALARRKGFKRWGNNPLRHTWISCKLVITRNKYEVANDAGTSLKMIDKHYKHLIGLTPARQWFNILPDDAAIRQMTFDRQLNILEGVPFRAQAS